MGLHRQGAAGLCLLACQQLLLHALLWDAAQERVPNCSRQPTRPLYTPARRPTQISPEGQVLRVLMDPEGSRVSHTSSCTEHAGRLFVGNLGKDYVSVLDLAVPPEQQQQQEGTGTAAAGTAK